MGIEKAGQSVATLGGGCFWCLEALFRELKGVEKIVSGYGGGHVENPSYDEVCGKQTGHAEVVQITFDPAVITYHSLLEIFFAIHDPTTLNRQGNDIGPQYRSIIMYHSQEQRGIAEKVIHGIDALAIWGRPIVTELVPISNWYAAEHYHQNYFSQNREQGYCHAVISPKVTKFRHYYIDKLKVHSCPTDEK